MDRSLISLGTDPELFAQKDGQVVPAYFAMQGDVDWELPFGKAYPDGAAVEFTVEPSVEPETITLRMRENLKRISDGLSASGHSATLISNARIDQSYIDRLPESFGKRASLQILGCSPDVRVYKWCDDIQRPNPKTYPYRTIGTHIHVVIGDRINMWPFVQFTTAFFDAALGTAGVFMLGNDRAAVDRNKLYGKSGTIRTKEQYQAIEYRTLPSQAVLTSPEHTRVMFALAQEASWVAHQIYDKGGYALMRDVLGGLDGMKSLTLSIDEHMVSACRSLQMLFVERVRAQLGSEANNLLRLVLQTRDLKVSSDYTMMGW